MSGQTLEASKWRTPATSFALALFHMLSSSPSTCPPPCGQHTRPAGQDKG